jgi:RNA recognition motif-containing protein
VVLVAPSKETGDCKGYAFVEFYSLEYSQYFMNSFGKFVHIRIFLPPLASPSLHSQQPAGSTSKGDSSSPQFIVDNRAVTLEFAREGDRDRDSNRYGPGGPGGANDRQDKDSKNDWICDRVRGFCV